MRGRPFLGRDHLCQRFHCTCIIISTTKIAYPAPTHCSRLNVCARPPPPQNQHLWQPHPPRPHLPRPRPRSPLQPLGQSARGLRRTVRRATTRRKRVKRKRSSRWVWPWSIYSILLLIECGKICMSITALQCEEVQEDSCYQASGQADHSKGKGCSKAKSSHSNFQQVKGKREGHTHFQEES